VYRLRLRLRTAQTRFQASFVSRPGQDSKANGASLDVKVSYPPARGEHQSVKGTSRCSCVATDTCEVVRAVFEATGPLPARRSSASPRSNTVLPVACQPAYLVLTAAKLPISSSSPGDGCGSTWSGRRSSRRHHESNFAASRTPVSSFELYLLRVYSALGANGNLCNSGSGCRPRCGQNAGINRTPRSKSRLPEARHHHRGHRGARYWAPRAKYHRAHALLSSCPSDSRNIRATP